MKICIVNTYYYPNIVGGAEISVLKLAEQLYKDGNEVHILCTDTNDKEEIINGVNVHRIKVKNICSPIEAYNNERKLNLLQKLIFKLLDKYNIFNYNIIFKKLKKINPDIVHINNVNGISAIIWKVARKLNIPIVQTLRDYSLLGTNDSVKENIKRIIYSYLTRNIECATAPSKYSLDKFTNNGYFKNSIRQVIYNAIDFSEKDVKEVLELKKSRLINEEKKIKFVFLGRLEQEKGIEILVNYFKEVKNDDIELLIAGKGSYENFVREAEKLDKRIKYLGFINEEQKNNLLIQCDVLVIPSLWPEPFGRVIIEAYKFAMPVIGTINGGIPEVIKNNKTGLLVDPNNLNKFKSDIEFFSVKENILNIIDECANEINKYDIITHSREFRYLYKKVVDTKKNIK